MAAPQISLRTLLCACALLSCTAANALDAASYTGYANADNFNPYDRQQDLQQGTTGAPHAYGVNVDGNVATSITSAAGGGSAWASSQSAGAYSTEGDFVYGGGAGADSRVAYHVMLVGPDAPFVVPVHVVAHGEVSGGGSTQASVSFVVNYDAGGSAGQLLAGASMHGTGSDSFSFDQVTAFKVNAVFDVYLSADSGSGGPGVQAGSSTAFVDPIFTIDDPLYAGLYHFEGIPSVAVSVPEPAGAALALLGLGVIFAARRRRAMA